MIANKTRSLAKAISWRILASADTFLISYIITGKLSWAGSITLLEIITKTVLYYLHERAWFKINLSKDGRILESRKRHIAKTITWRFIGTLDTMILAWIISGDPLTGLKIGFAEVITKMILYYLHERTWYKINYGLNERRK